MKKIKSKIRWFLIRLANMFADDDYYALGDEIVGVHNFGDDLIVFTKGSIYSTKDYKKFKKLTKVE